MKKIILFVFGLVFMLLISNFPFSVNVSQASEIISGVSVHSFDSEQAPKYPATFAIDGKTSTFWASQYSPTLKPHPHFIALDLGKSYSLEGLNYLPRQDKLLHGTVTKYELYVSDDTKTWGTAVSTGTLAANSTLKKITFTAKQGRYVKFVSLADAANSNVIVAAEISVIEEGKIDNNMGPEIAVGLWSYSKDNLEDNAFSIDANKDYVIKDKDGNKIASVSASSTTKVKYIGDKNLRVYSSIDDEELNKEVRFEAKDGNNSNLILDVHRPNSSYDEYRGKIKLKYNSTDGNIWVINTLPMEQYVWGMGETTGTGPIEHTKVMTTIFRNYGYWYKEYATKYLPYGFTIRSDSGSQIYRGYDWDVKYPNIRKAADKTKGIIIKYDDEVALTPYCSWSDGYTRRYEDGHWGGYKDISDYKGKASKIYPWLDSVKDPYGKHPSYSTKTLANSGNHMVGLIANGSVKLDGDSYKKTNDWILKYYYDDIVLKKMY